MSAEDVVTEYVETDEERALIYRDGDRVVELATPRQGYGMLVVRTPEAGEIERYYGLDMALDHVAELLGRPPRAISVPAAAEDFGI